MDILQKTSWKGYTSVKHGYYYMTGNNLLIFFSVLMLLFIRYRLVATILAKSVGILQNQANSLPPFNVVFVFKLFRIFCWIIDKNFAKIKTNKFF